MPAKQHDFTATEIKAGILVLVSFFILVGFLVAIRGCRPQDESAKTFYAVFTDISGLNRGADVRFGGVRVGKVIAIEPDPEDRARIRVTRVKLRGFPSRRIGREGLFDWFDFVTGTTSIRSRDWMRCVTAHRYGALPSAPLEYTSSRTVFGSTFHSTP